MGHLVEQTSTSNYVTLRCHDCAWTAHIGYDTRALDYQQAVDMQPLVTLIKWGHADPNLLKNDAADEIAERSLWRRVRAALGGKP